MYLLEIFFLTIAILFFFNSFGFFIINKIFFLDKNNQDLVYVSSILGVSIFVISTSFFYFILDFNIKLISILFIIVFILTLIINLYNNKDIFFKVNCRILLLVWPIILVFVFLAYFYGQQFYVFRGNHWDYFHYIKQSLLVFNYNFSSFKNIETFQYLAPDKDILFRNGTYQLLNDVFMYNRPAVSLFLSFILNFKFLNLFQIVYCFTIVLLSLICISAYFFILKVFNRSSVVLPIIFTLSFWTIYIFEISALAHLLSLGIIISMITLSFFIIEELNKKNYSFFLIFSLFNVSIFIIYPEIFVFYSIYLVLLFTFFLIFFRKIIKDNINILFFSLVIFIFVSLLGLTSSYKHLIWLSSGFNFIKNIDFWGYYGAFIIGKENLVQDLNFVAIVKKKILLNNLNIFQLIEEIINQHFDKGFYFLFLNIIPSLYGLYFLSVSKIENFNFLIFLVLTIFLNFYFIKIVIKNFINLFKKIDNYSLVFFSLLLTWFCCSLILSFNGAMWGLIKLYFYFFPIFFIFAYFYFKQTNKNFFLKPNKKLLILLVFFPFYKYGIFNNGIGRYDSFPSIINQELKKNFSWNINEGDLKGCNNFLIDINLDSESLPKLYYIKLILDYNNIIYSYSNVANKTSNSYDCKIDSKDKTFRITRL